MPRRTRLHDLVVDVDRVAGPRDARVGPFVLVHGIGVSSRYFRPLVEELARHGEVWLVDLPGFGSTPTPESEVTIADHAAVVAELIEGEGLVRPTVVGHSMGTQVVSQLAVDRPDLVGALALLGPTSDAAARTVPQHTLRLLTEMVLTPWSVKAVVTADYIRCGIRYYVRQLPNLLQDRIEQRMPMLACRVLVVRGRRDPIVPRRWARTLAALAPYGRFAEVRGTHVVMFTDPERTARLIVAVAS